MLLLPSPHRHTHQQRPLIRKWIPVVGSPFFFFLGGGNPSFNLDKKLNNGIVGFSTWSNGSKAESEKSTWLFHLCSKTKVQLQQFRFLSWEQKFKTNSGKMIWLFKLEAKWIVKSNFCFSIWEPNLIVELDFRFSLWSRSSKQIPRNQLPQTTIGFGVAMAYEWPKSTRTYMEPGHFPYTCNMAA